MSSICWYLEFNQRKANIRNANPAGNWFFVSDLHYLLTSKEYEPGRCDEKHQKKDVRNTSQKMNTFPARLI